MYLLCFLTGGLGAFLAMQFADRIGINDIPNVRSSHEKIIPKGGGIGVLAAFIISALILEIPIPFWMAALAISLVSFLGGDKHLLSVQKRLVIQFCCTFFLLYFFLFSHQVSLTLYLLYIPISVFVVGTSNFYNFMDGIDGIVGIASVVGFSLLAFYAFISGFDNDYGILCIAIVSSCLGFLLLNLPRARVFLGDVGSIFLGFLFASLVVILSENLLDFFVMVGFLVPFYFDEFFTMAIRIKDGDSLILAHRKHIYQLVANELGISHLRVSLSYGLAQLIIGISAIFVKPYGLYYLLLSYIGYSLIFIIISIYIHKRASTIF